MMQYKGYTGKVEFDDEAEIFHGEVIGLRDVITFQGRTVDEVKGAFRESWTTIWRSVPNAGRNRKNRSPANSWFAFHPTCTVRFTSPQRSRDQA